jgi:hypothetical protein
VSPCLFLRAQVETKTESAKRDDSFLFRTTPLLFLPI